MTACRRHRWRCDLYTLVWRYLECARCGARKLAAIPPTPTPHDLQWVANATSKDRA